MNSVTKAIILAGGTGSRLYPCTKVINKHLLPIFDKPLIFYPLSVLMLADIREIAIVTSPSCTDDLQALLGDGAFLGLSIEYIVQPQPKGLSDAILRAKEFIDGDPIGLILGDNLFFSSGISGLLAEMFVSGSVESAGIVTVSVPDPERFGVVEKDLTGRIVGLVEKPTDAVSNRAVTGLYRLPGSAADRAAQLVPSQRGELEITDLLNSYLKGAESLEEFRLPRGAVWFDAGTTDSMLSATQFVSAYQAASGCFLGCPEEVALRKGWVKLEELVAGVSNSWSKSPYMSYLMGVERLS